MLGQKRTTAVDDIDDPKTHFLRRSRLIFSGTPLRPKTKLSRKVTPGGMINLEYMVYSCDPAIVGGGVTKFVNFPKSAQRRPDHSIQEQAADPRVSVLHR
jgi:hypothetical protein